MKKILFVIFFLSTQLVFAQAEKEVEAAVERMRVAFLSEDAATLRTLTSEDLSYGHSSGTIENQAQFLAVFENKAADYQKWDITDQTVTLHGKKLALVRHNVSIKVFEKGAENTVELGILLVWTKEKGSWKLLARQAFRLPTT